MDYEKAYKKALERAKKNYDVAQDLCNGSQIGVECFKNTLTNIFPELTESEDERIRKRLIDLIYKVYAFTNYITCVEYENIIAWLEKQGDKSITLPKWKYKNDNTPLLRDSIILNKYGCVAKSPSGAIISDAWVLDYDELAKLPKEELEKQGEQKPFDYENTNIQQKDFAPKQEWSEEDDYNLQCMIAKVTYDIQKGNVGRNNELMDWLKSLKDRVQPQPKQEWSEEDEKIRKELINVFSNREKYLIDQSFGDITVSEALAWLKKQGEQKPIISVAYMVSKYASTPEQGNKGFGKPINCMVRAYRQGILDTLKKIKENNVVEEQQNTNEQNTQKFVTEDKSLSDKHQWEDGDIIRLKNDDGVRWQIFKSPESEINEEWFMSQIMENGIAGGYVSSLILDTKYEFLYNPHKEFLKKH